MGCHFPDLYNGGSILKSLKDLWKASGYHQHVQSSRAPSQKHGPAHWIGHDTVAGAVFLRPYWGAFSARSGYDMMIFSADDPVAAFFIGETRNVCNGPNACYGSPSRPTCADGPLPIA